MNGTEPILSVAFFRTASSNEPVREWLKSLPREERRDIGEEIKTVQFGWPLGRPLVRKLDTIRSPRFMKWYIAPGYSTLSLRAMPPE